MPGVAPPSPRRDRLSPAELAWATLSSPVGPLAVGCTAAGLAQVRFRTSPRDRLRTGLAAPPASGGRAGGPAQAQDEVLAAARDQLAEYFAGQRRALRPADRLDRHVTGAAPGAGRCCSARSATARRSPTGSWRSARWPGRTGHRLPARAIGADHGLEPDPGDRAVPPGGRGQRAGRVQRRHRHRGQAVAADLRGGAARHAGLGPRPGWPDGLRPTTAPNGPWRGAARRRPARPSRCAAPRTRPCAAGARPAASRRVPRRPPPASAAGSPGARRSPRAARRPGCRRSAAGSVARPG